MGTQAPGKQKDAGFWVLFHIKPVLATKPHLHTNSHVHSSQFPPVAAAGESLLGRLWTGARPFL